MHQAALCVGGEMPPFYLAKLAFAKCIFKFTGLKLGADWVYCF